MKLPRALAYRPTPEMPKLPGYAPCFDPLPVAQSPQLSPAVRPLYWWAAALREMGDIVIDMRFDRSAMAATVVTRLACGRVISEVRRYEDTACTPQDLTALMAEAIWRLGALGWAEEFGELVQQMRAAGVVGRPVRVQRSLKPIPGWVHQPEADVRIAYWWAAALLKYGWRLDLCGGVAARRGFLAEIPNPDGSSQLVVYPGDIAGEESPAAALARHLAQMDRPQRLRVQRLIDHVSGEKGRVV